MQLVLLISILFIQPYLLILYPNLKCIKKTSLRFIFNHESS